MDSNLGRLADSLMELVESDRARVADVLGDEIVSVITMARYLIEDAAQRLTRGETDEASEALQNASTRLRDVVCQLLVLCSELHPKALDDLGLLPALSSYFRDFSQENRAIFVSRRITVSESDVPSGLKLAIFRIVQAALSNVARHSKASAARVFLSTFEDELRLGVEDNGVGFDVERWQHRRHGQDGYGLRMILRRVETSGGQCAIEAAPRHGARIQVHWRLASATPTVGSEGAKPLGAPA